MPAAIPTFDALDAAYRATRFVVELPDGPQVLRIGTRNDAIDAMLAARGVQCAAVLTAWNPGSRILTDDENAARQRRLLEELERRGFTDQLPGRGIGADPDWTPEDSVLVVGMPRRAAIRHGRRFGQSAIVVHERGCATELVYARIPCTLHAFEGVCLLASAQRWCWRIGCTTCGCMHFRDALGKLLDGRHPGQPGWNRPLLDEPEAQQRLAERVADANLARIARVTRFPDWLGYLGLVLFFTAAAERTTGRLTQAWLPQLNAMLDGSPKELDRLTYRDLSAFEDALSRYGRMTLK